MDETKTLPHALSFPLEELNPKERFYAALQKQKALVKSSSLILQGIQDKAWLRFSRLGLPDRKKEAFQYVPLSSFYEKTYQKPSENSRLFTKEDCVEYIYPECRQAVLVFVNGIYQKELSDLSALPKQVVALSLTQAASSYRSFLQNRLLRSLEEENDPFALLNSALQDEGLFLFIPPRLEEMPPVQILHLIDTPKESDESDKPYPLVVPRIQLFLGAFSRLKCVMHTVSSTEKPLWINSGLDVALEDSAHLELVELLPQGERLWHFATLRASLKKDGSFRFLTVGEGGQTSRLGAHITLTGEGSSAHLQGINMLAESRGAHTHVVIDHQAPRTSSRQLFKGVLSDVSQSSFEGKILVRPEAQKTEAYQLSNHLILGARALAQSKPNLEILADDVKASHGATVGQLSPEQLFYLKTRGLSSHEAKSLLIGGFCREVLEEIFLPSVKKKAQILAQEYLIKGKTP